MASASDIMDKNPKPPGLVPKNVQSWLLIGIALLMVLIMWVTGGKKPVVARRALPGTPSVQAPLEVNEAKIVELQSRIQQLQREQALAASALAHENFRLNPNSDSPGPASGNPAGQSEEPIHEERRKRAYQSLFASNVALSFRKNPEIPMRAAPQNPPNASPDSSQFPELLRPAAVVSIPTPPPKEPAAARDRKEEQQNSISQPADAPPAPAEKTYLLFEGTILESILLNRLDGQFSGPVECLLTTEVYSHDRQHLLLPAGTKILGESRKVESLGQTRLAVAFHRLVMPDGYSASLDHFAGLNQPGDVGLRDQVNNHYARLFGVSLAIGALGAVAEAGTSGALTASGTDLMRQGFAQSTGQSAAQILDRFLNVLPTITIREGHRIKIYLSGDLALPDYLHHTLPANL